MVCSVENGRMTVMARILRGPNVSHNVAGSEWGDVGSQKFLARYIQKEFIEADEPNLLDEEDMHIFGLKPMDDPLHLVYCSACTKPVKASHYATHADLCGVLSSTRNEKVELKSNVECRKPPKKPKGNGPSVRANQLAEGSSRNLMKAKVGSFSNVAKGMLPTTYKSGNLPSFKFPKSEEQNHNVVDQSCHKNLHGNDMQYQAQADVPVPLATKIYYSQRNNRLRSEIGYMFHATDSQELDYNIKVEATQLDITQSKISLQRSTPSGQKSCTGLKTVTNPQITDSKTLYEKLEVMYRLEDGNKSTNHRLQNPL